MKVDRLVVVAFALLVAGCGPSTRAAARAGVLATAEGLRTVDQACAGLALQRGDRELAEACAAGYDGGRAGLLVTAGVVDAWDRPEARARVACGLVAALAGLDAMLHAMARRGYQPPPIVADARALAGAVGGCPRGS